ncbi:MAG: alpha/beta hydrolase [Caldiserica bacterium]|nr:alpha/beta hydrolase [Caldisericota bacterium]
MARVTVVAAFVCSFAATALGVTEIHDVVYRTVDGVALALDIYLPGGAGPHPAVVLVHGGAWHTGDKRRLAPLARFLAERGYVAFSINYRLAPDFTFPAALEDLRCAVKWIRAHAADYAVDPDRIAALGTSAGAHLVALLGTAPEAVGACGDPGIPSRIRAVIALFGPMDLLSAAGTPAERAVEGFLGAAAGDAPDLWREASPITWVSPDDPPFLLIHGRADRVVPYEESVRMADALRRAGVEVGLLIIPGAGHGFINRPDTPAARTAVAAILDFLDDTLAGP